MIEFTILLGLISVVVLCILLNKVSDFFSKTERSLTEIKKRLRVLDETMEGMIEGEVVTAAAPAERVVAEEVMAAPRMVGSVALEEEFDEEEVLTEPEPEVEEEELVHATVCEPMEEQAHVIAEIEVPREAAAQEQVVQPKKKVNYERFIGENLFGKIGILIFVIGVGLFVKYAIDQEWINETLRTILGFLTGGALLATAGALQKRYRTFSSLLAGGAFAVFYLTVAIAFHYYQLFSHTAAFVLLVGITVFMSTLAVVYDRRELAITSLVGGFLAPFIISSGEGSYLVLFTYVSVLNIGMFCLSLYKKWGELPVISFGFTYVIMAFFMVMGYSASLYEGLAPVYLLGFATLFYFIFLLPILSIVRIEGRGMSNVLLSVIVANNFLYLFFGLMFLDDVELPFHATGLLTLFIALVNLGLIAILRRFAADSRRLFYTMLGLVLTFVSITVPIQLDGNYVTLFWASEMVLLLWLYVKSKVKIYEYASLALVCLTLISFVMDLFDVAYAPSQMIFMNGSFATSLFMGLATGAFALLLQRHQSFFTTVRLLKYSPWNAIMWVASTVILYYTFMAEFYSYFQGDVRSAVMVLFSSASFLVVCSAFGRRFSMEQYRALYLLSMGLNVLILALNIWIGRWTSPTFGCGMLLWAAAATVGAHLYYVARRYYALVGVDRSFTVYLTLLATLLWVTMVRFFCLQMGVVDFKAGLSLALSVAGFVQMGLGMRLHLKVLRILSLWVFAVVLFKLVTVDLWALPTIGKIVVFIILGLLLLVLSFLYQKLKNVLFKDDNDEAE